MDIGPLIGLLIGAGIGVLICWLIWITTMPKDLRNYMRDIERRS